MAILEAQQSDDEIDLGEIFAALWAYKLLVACCTGLGILLTAFYALFLVTPTYEAQNRFELNEASRESFGNLGGLASLAGVGIDRGGASEAEKLEDRMFSRVFLSQIAESAGLYKDPVFNTTLRPPGLKTQVFKMVGLGSDEAPTQARIDATVARNFEDAVSLTIKDNGILEAKVTHSEPDRAALIANIVVSQTLQNLYEMQRTQADEKLEYFAERLFTARTELDQSIQSLQDYSLEKTLLSREELARSSAQLASLRDRSETLRQRRLALDELAEIAGKGNGFDAAARDAFFENHPTASSIEFRRLLNWTSAEESWTLPELTKVVTLERSLDEQMATLTRAIRDLEKDAEQSAEAATELESLRREVAVNEAIYEAMLKQFESEALKSGFSVESGQIIDTAVAPLEPSAPRKSLIVALGLVMGAFVGIGIALLRTMQRGILHTKGALHNAFALHHTTDAHRTLKNQSVQKFLRGLRALGGKPMRAVEDLLVQIASGTSSRIAIMPSAGGRLTTNGSLAIAALQRESSDSLCLVDLTDDGDLVRHLGLRQTSGNPVELEQGLFVVHPNLGDGPKRSDGVEKVLDALSAQFKQLVIVCPSPECGTAVSQKAVGNASAIVIIAQSGHTTRSDAEKITSLLELSPNIPAGLICA